MAEPTLSRLLDELEESFGWINDQRQAQALAAERLDVFEHHVRRAAQIACRLRGQSETVRAA